MPSHENYALLSRIVGYSEEILYLDVFLRFFLHRIQDPDSLFMQIRFYLCLKRVWVSEFHFSFHCQHSPTLISKPDVSGENSSGNVHIVIFGNTTNQLQRF